jgi:formate hydrogenlyase subunit 6/NADH:ubiquinone oxidoreductase subunit I
LASLLDALASRKYDIIGPTVRDGAVVYDRISSPQDLPQGWSDEQDAGSYRLKKTGASAYFDHNLGPHSWKKFLLSPSRKLWQASSERGVIDIAEDGENPGPLAFVGVRPCELHSLKIQARILALGSFPDIFYGRRLKGLIVVAVNCGRAGGTCFCASMNTGPKAISDFDLALTEVANTDQHFFIVEIGSDQGADVLMSITYQEVTDADIDVQDKILKRTISQMRRSMDTTGIRELLFRNHDNPRWDDVAGRCLTCANCTLVCPTCFCTTVEDTTDLTGKQAERWRRWDSCFTVDFSYIHGGSIRLTGQARYRQWLTHKLASWIDQFGTSGCVGCGRCITWCPAAIDITEEVRAIRDSELVGAAAVSVKESKNANN